MGKFENFSLVSPSGKVFPQLFSSPHFLRCWRLQQVRVKYEPLCGTLFMGGLSQTSEFIAMPFW
ncbi:hypothetical protein A3L04_08120 [Thermococcus chitonophagus]|uniref:Uncharacterized protein n=1 Tax=Thermococcus chitonophagus TaxID=54262 RepID=A0A2Z2NGC7_9EURY|nr:hypothetical protein A3L04_08120 [Thermococcus chitonophagus]